MSSSQTYPFQFTGSGAGYFRVWIVNIALTLVTLGVYSAWAKVRTQRWFYGHTLLDGQAFSYHAQPLQILKGRAIAVAALILYFAIETLFPLLTPILIAVLFVLLPWIIVNALRFNARQSAYRGLRFNFVGTWNEAFRIYTLWPLLLPPTLGLIFPYLAYRQTRFFGESARYGAATAQFSGSIGSFYRLYLGAGGLAIALVMLFSFGLFFFLGAATIGAVSGNAFNLMTLSIFVLPLIVAAYIKARTANRLYNGVTFTHTAAVPTPPTSPFDAFDDSDNAPAPQTFNAHFISRQRARTLIWLYLSNLVLIVGTFALFTPWAKVRLARYRAACLDLVGPADMGGCVAGLREEANALGGEVADVFDIDVGIA